MPTPPSERRALERELAGLPDQIAGYERELTETPDGPEHGMRRERLDWQIRNCRKRLAGIEGRLAAIRAEGS